MKLKIEYVPIGSIKPYKNNAKLHPKEQIEQIKKSMQEFGNIDPIGIWNGEIVEGHGRYLAAKALQLETVPVIRLDELTDEQRKAYALVHNKLTMNSDFDLDILSDELDKIFDIDMSDFGFDSQSEKKVKEDDFDPEPPQQPKSKLGDVYRLGRHRLMCGDSTSIDSVQKLCGGAVIDMLLTDPPYNVDYEGTAGKIKNDNMDSNSFRQFLRDAFVSARSVMKAGSAFHIWHAETEGYNFRGALADAGFTCRQQLIWVKSSQTLGRQDFQRMYEGVLTGDTFIDNEMIQNGYEPCLYGWKDGAGHKWYKKRKEKDVLFFDKPAHSAEHPTMKPILLFDYEMKCNTKGRENVLDLFGGSGTTIMAAEQNGRNAFVMEFDPKFVDVIIKRWEDFTGEKAVLLNE